MSLPLGPFYVNHQLKANTPYGFWARETLQWDLKCEANGLTRQKAYDLVSETVSNVDDDQGNRYIKLMWWLNMIGILVISTIGACCIFYFAKEGHHQVKAQLANVAIQLVFCIIMIWISFATYNSFAHK